MSHSGTQTPRGRWKLCRAHRAEGAWGSCPGWEGRHRGLEPEPGLDARRVRRRWAHSHGEGAGRGRVAMGCRRGPACPLSLSTFGLFRTEGK